MARATVGVKIDWSRTAEADMERIWHFLEERSLVGVDRVETRIRDGVGKLADLPMIGRPRPDGGRELSLRDVRYKIGYFVEEQRILISTVRSTREAA